MESFILEKISSGRNHKKGERGIFDRGASG